MDGGAWAAAPPASLPAWRDGGRLEADTDDNTRKVKKTDAEDEKKGKKNEMNLSSN